eukprot:gnl/MRDRNA2_/MRDRNA2_28090_c0_seq1.p1 gnl/MRDRNA2_/MRDRNA2_28090_c0~~gnl/MRDRNA2_/MRDRNA2_28090_c0_seq1.p1  ORF type:complete len:430 (+),score=73.84 gnl/MRDRNA2_/MRDRNA2_28090_c0_seq1:75-1364(+)
MKACAAVLASIHVYHMVYTKASVIRMSDKEDTFHSVAEWMRKHSASVSLHLQGAFRSHGGASIRSVISTEDLPKGTVLMNLPRNTWIWEGTPAFSDLVGQKEAVSQNPSCRLSPPQEITKMIVAAGMAREKAKGTDSTLYLALKSFPTYNDYYSFHPRLAGPEILRDFGSLGISEIIKAQQVIDSNLQQCFIAWKSNSSSIDGVEWLNVHEALEQIRTRAFGVPEIPGHPAVVIPLADLLNTAPAPEYNTLWHAGTAAFTMTAKGSSANAELYDPYCAKCDNKIMLLRWGIYLEDNSNRGLSMKCATHQASNKLLHDATIAALETQKNFNWTAPRCKAAVFKTPQGAMRCSLARLSWEACGSQWAGNASLGVSFRGLSLSSNNKAAKRFKSSQSKRSASKQWAIMQATLLDQSYRHQLHPALLTDSSHV